MFRELDIEWLEEKASVARAHYDSEIDYKRKKAAGLIKAIKGLVDRADIYFAAVCSGFEENHGMCVTITASITQFAVQLQEAAADCRRCEELKNQLGEFLSEECVPNNEWFRKERI